jgi:O-antigen/teichoic acid export membrane protein
MPHSGDRRGPRQFARAGRLFGYGFIAQACSAGTNFALVVAAAHLLGPSGLGTLLIGFATYVLALGFARALLTEPLIARSSGQEAANQNTAARASITLILAASIVVAGSFALLGVTLPSRIGHGLVLFAPWMIPALMQDTGRSVVFRDRQDWSALCSDAAWLLAMALTIPIAFFTSKDWLITGTWGIGATVGALVTLVQLQWRPLPLRPAVSWWRREASQLARWLGSQQLLYGILSYATVLLLAGVLGTQSYGGLRAVQSIFTPLTLLGPALALPGLPLVSRLIEQAPRAALGVAVKLAIGITAITAAYVCALYAFPSALGLVFGTRFNQFRDILIPMGLGQVLSAPAYGLTLYLKAKQRGGALFILGTVTAIAYLALTVTLGATFGLSGAAWAATGTGIVTIATLTHAIRRT